MTDRLRVATDWILLAGFCGFLFFFGLGDFGLVGADEPRYAQVAREMFDRRDWTTPTLGGKPWLEKPVLYYWQAILAYRMFGVSDRAARMPSAFDAMLMVVAVFLFLRRFRPGFQLDGALMSAACAGTIGFARAASTDMPLAALFTIAMLAWYGWFKDESKIALAIFYVFLGLAALAKGPIAPFLAGVIIAAFALARQEAKLIWRTLWLPGIFSFCVVALPWYVAVQLRNPEFFRTFFIEHNLARFGTDLYRHTQPFWYYVPVALVSFVPWSVFVVAAVVARLKTWWESQDALGLFLLIWLFVPLVFFSMSRSKLPGYVLPALTAGTLLLAEYARERASDEEHPHFVLAITHALVVAVPIVLSVMLQYVLLQHRLPWNRASLVSVISAVAMACVTVTALRSRLGFRALRTVTIVPVVLCVAFILKIGAPALDAKLSSRPLAEAIARMETRKMPLAVLAVRREVQYGLHFYRNQEVPGYELDQIPKTEHIVVTEQGLRDQVQARVGDRRVTKLGSFPVQHLEYYWVAGASPP